MNRLNDPDAETVQRMELAASEIATALDKTLCDLRQRLAVQYGLGTSSLMGAYSLALLRNVAAVEAEATGANVWESHELYQRLTTAMFGWVEEIARATP